MDLYERNTRCMDERGTIYRADVYLDLETDKYFILRDRLRAVPYEVTYDPDDGGWWDVVPITVNKLYWQVLVT